MRTAGPSPATIQTEAIIFNTRKKEVFQMSDTSLRQKKCQPCEGGTEPLKADVAQALVAQTDGWVISEDESTISREFRFKDFYQTIAFINALAWVANQQDHHPDFEAGYNRCVVRYTTHAINGLSENDFICAAHIDALF